MSTPALPGIFGAVEPVLNHYGYLAVGFLVTIEDFGIPVPGETVLIAAALFAGAGRLNIVAVGIVGFLAAIVGDNIGFLIGHFGGRALALRWGKYVFLTPERLDKAQSFFERHGGKIIVVARFIEGLRQANGIVAGISGMHWRRFLLFNAIGAALWVGVWVSVGYLAGNHITTIYNQITRYSLYVLIAAAVAVVAFIAWHLRSRSTGPEARRRPVSGISRRTRRTAPDVRARPASRRRSA
jgi:membrane protein DedA with SNARE-associated domain